MRRRRARGSLGAALAACAAFLLCGDAHAGPPLLADDPHVVGQGNVQLILAFDGLREGNLRILQGPVLDITVGLHERVDLVLVMNPIFEKLGPLPTEHGGAITGGVKWQLVKSDRWNVAFTPTIGVDVITAQELAFALPVQMEYTRERFAIGIDAGYIAVVQAEDQWLVAPYATWQVAEPLALMADVFAVGIPNGLGTTFGFTGGFELSLGRGFSLLASGGTGFASSNTARLSWKAYAGLFYAFDWFAPKPSARAGASRIRPSPLAGRRP